MNNKRLMIKLSGEALSGSKGFGIDNDVVEDICKKIIKLHNYYQIVIVVGGGNCWRGRTNRRMDRVRADNIGMLATNMNSLILQDKFIELGEKVVVQSAIEMNKIIKFVNIDDAIESINNGSIVIFGGGTANPLFSTDTAAAIRAIETKCDIMVKLTNVDGVYTDDPRINSNVRKYSTISYDEIIINDLKVLDMECCSLCKNNRMPIIVCDISDDSINKLCNREVCGTIIR